MTDTPTPAPGGVGLPLPPHERWWHHIHPRHRSFRSFVVHVGYWSTIAWIVLILATPAIGDRVYPYRLFIDGGYILIQMAEIVSQDHLRNKEVYWDWLWSGISAFFSFGLVLLFGLGDRFITTEAWYVLLGLFFWSNFDFWFGMMIHNAILNQVYQREEQESDTAR